MLFVVRTIGKHAINLTGRNMLHRTFFRCCKNWYFNNNWFSFATVYDPKQKEVSFFNKSESLILFLFVPLSRNIIFYILVDLLLTFLWLLFMQRGCSDAFYDCGNFLEDKVSSKIYFSYLSVYVKKSIKCYNHPNQQFH